MALGAWLHLVNIVCNYIFPATLPARALTIDRREHLATTLLWSLLNIHDIQHPSPQCTLQSPFNRNAALSIVVSIMEVRTRSKFMYPQRKGAQYHKHTCKQSTHTSSKTGSREKEVIKETRQLVQVEEKTTSRLSLVSMRSTVYTQPLPEMFHKHTRISYHGGVTNKIAVTGAQPVPVHSNVNRPSARGIEEEKQIAADK